MSLPCLAQRLPCLPGWQVREASARAGVHLGGENALPCFSPMHIDDTALDRIVYNTGAWGPPLQACASRPSQRMCLSPTPPTSCVMLSLGCQPAACVLILHADMQASYHAPWLPKTGQHARGKAANDEILTHSAGMVQEDAMKKEVIYGASGAQQASPESPAEQAQQPGPPSGPR